MASRASRIKEKDRPFGFGVKTAKTEKQVENNRSIVANPAEQRLTREQTIAKQMENEARNASIKNKLLEEEVKRQQQKQIESEPMQEVQQEPMQPIDNRNIFQKLFMPTTEEGEARRLKSFGTTSKIPAIGAALAIGATAGVAGAALTPALALSSSTAVASTATATSLTKGIKSLGLLWLAGKTVEITNKDLNDADRALSESLSASSNSLSAVRKGEMSPEEANFIITLTESNLNDLEQSYKLNKKINPFVILTGGSKYATKLFLARQQVQQIKEMMFAARQQALINQAEAKYGQ